MKMLNGLVISAVALSFSHQLLAQEKVEIEWDKPEKYRDVRPSNEPRKRFRESTFKQITEYMNELAEGLPENKKLLIKVSDLDLAGQVWPASFVGLGHSNSDVRIIKDIYMPRMSFSYQLLDESGLVIKQTQVNLKDMSFLHRSSRVFKSDSLRYEKEMLKRWFEKEFESQLAQKQNNPQTANSEA